MEPIKLHGYWRSAPGLAVALRWKRSCGTALFRSRCAGSTSVVNAKEIGDLDEDGAALGDIADPPFSRIRTYSGV